MWHKLRIYIFFIGDKSFSLTQIFLNDFEEFPLNFKAYRMQMYSQNVELKLLRSRFKSRNTDAHKICTDYISLSFYGLKILLLLVRMPYYYS